MRHSSLHVIWQKPEIATSFSRRDFFFLAALSDDLDARGIESNDRKSRERSLFEETWCQAWSDKNRWTRHGRKSRRRWREKAISTDHNKRTGWADRVQMILLLSVLQWELTTQQLFRRLAFYARAILVGKQARTTRAEVHRTSLQCNRFVEIVVQLVPSDRRTTSRKGSFTAPFFMNLENSVTRFQHCSSLRVACARSWSYFFP